MGGQFTMSDDSHGIAQVSTNYTQGLSYLENLGVKELWTFLRQPQIGEPSSSKARLLDKAVPVEEFRAHFKP